VEPVSVVIGAAPELRPSVHVSADYFSVFGITTSLGHVLTDTEDVSGGPKHALISDRLWRAHFGGVGLGGHTLVIDHAAYEVVGVVSPDAPVDPRIDVWLPLQADLASLDHSSWLQVVARLRPNVNPSAAARELADPSRIIVGIVAEVRDTGLNHHPEPMMYVPVGQVLADGVEEECGVHWMTDIAIDPLRDESMVLAQFKGDRPVRAQVRV
jgi:hypothetical protein